MSGAEEGVVSWIIISVLVHESDLQKYLFLRGWTLCQEMIIHDTGHCFTDKCHLGRQPILEDFIFLYTS